MSMCKDLTQRTTDFQKAIVNSQLHNRSGTIKTDYRLRQTHRQNQEKLAKRQSRRFISNTLKHVL